MHPFYDFSRQFFGQDETWWIGLVSMAMYLLFWAVVVIVAYRLVRKYFIKREAMGVKEDSAMAIIRERYAKGEIDAEELKRMTQVLKEMDDPGGNP